MPTAVKLPPLVKLQQVGEHHRREFRVLAEVMAPTGNRLTFKKDVAFAGIIGALWRLDNATDLETSFILLQKVGFQFDY